MRPGNVRGSGSIERQSGLGCVHVWQRHARHGRMASIPVGKYHDRGSRRVPAQCPPSILDRFWSRQRVIGSAAGTGRAAAPWKPGDAVGSKSLQRELQRIPHTCLFPFRPGRLHRVGNLGRSQHVRRSSSCARGDSGDAASRRRIATPDASHDRDRRRHTVILPGQANRTHMAEYNAASASPG